jgi:hypothetical protein
LHYFSNKILICVTGLLISIACNRNQTPKDGGQAEGDPASSSRSVPGQQSLDSLSDPARFHPIKSSPSFLLKTVTGIVFSTGNDSASVLALETAGQEVIVLVGVKTALLRRHHHQKFSVTGFWRPATTPGIHDTLEVADFAFVREQSK